MCVCMYICIFGYSHITFQKRCFLELRRLYIIYPHTITVTTLHAGVGRRIKTLYKKITWMATRI